MATLSFDLTLRRGDFVLQARHCQVPGTGVTALFGPSGSGKSSLLQALAGILPAEGRIEHGRQCWQGAGCWCPPERRQIGFVFQDGGLFPHLNVRDNLRFPLRYARGPRRFTMDEVVDQLEIGHLLDHAVMALSGGQRQRVALARALLRQPEWLFLDEPLSALDRIARGRILRLLERLVHQLNLPILLVTHAVEEVERLADRVLFVEAGRVSAPVPLKEAVCQPDSPLFREEAPISILEGRCRTPCNEAGLGEIAIGTQRLLVPPLTQCPSGQAVRVRIPAAQVSLALAVVEGCSVLNQLAVQVEQIDCTDPWRCWVQLRLQDGQRFLAELTRHSVQQLSLASGKEAVALIKAVSVL